MEEAQALADRVAVMVAGRLVALGTPADLVSRERTASIVFALPPGVDAAALPPVSGAVRVDGDVVTIETTRATDDLHALTTWATQLGIDLPDLTLSRATLEDVYLKLTGADGDDA
jgi:ABC-2 type transport system ATP-binding protein